MSQPVSILQPALDDLEHLRGNLPVLLAELERRAVGDEVIVIDDTGEDLLGPALATEFPTVRVLVSPANEGFAHALRRGMDAAAHPLVFSMNPDVRVRPGFLEPLVRTLEDPQVAAAVPRVLLDADPEKIESLTAMRIANGMIQIDQPGLLGADVEDAEVAEIPVAFAVGGAVLLRRDEFLARGGFDPLFEPFYWEDVDLSWCAWRSGKKVVYVATATVEHHHRGTIGRRVPRELVRAAIEKNRLLFHWKHIDDPVRLRRHVSGLYGLVLDAWMEERREELLWLNLALDQLQAVLRQRQSMPPSPMLFSELAARTRPLPAQDS